jgi:hypothetical protein
MVNRRAGSLRPGARFSLPVALVALLLLFILPAPAQEPVATAGVDTNAFLIGDQINLTISVDHGTDFKIGNIAPADSLEGLEIVARGETERHSSGDAVSERTRFTITAFDSGTYVIPPFAVYYTGGADTLVRSAKTGPVAVFVHGVEVDTAGDIRAIKPPLGVPLTFLEVLPYLAVLAAAAGLVWLVSWFLRKRRSGEKFIPGPPPRPADELALEALRSLGAKRLWQRGMIKEYHSTLSDIVRTYIERRYLVPAMESTSDETLSFEPVRRLPPDDAATLKEILYRSDLVKFAKFVPEPGDHDSSLSGAVAFVEHTRRATPRAEAAVPDDTLPEGAVTDGAGGNTA